MNAEKSAEATTSESHYLGNPFKLTLAGVKQFWANTKSQLIGVVAMQFGLFVAIGLSAGIALVAGLTATLILLGESSNSNPFAAELVAMFGPDFATLANQLASLKIGAAVLAALGVIATLLIAVYLQAFQVAALGEGVIHNKTIVFKTIAKTAFRRTPALLGQFFIILGAIFVAGIPFVLISAVLKSESAAALGLNALYGLALSVGAFIISTKLAMTPYEIVVAGASPIKAMKNSWHLSKGRFVEILGVLAISLIMTLVVSLVTNLLSLLSELSQVAIVTLPISIIIVILGALSSLFSQVPLAKRYSQLVAIKAGGPKTDWGSNLGALGLAIVTAVIVGSLQMAIAPESPTPADNLLNPDQGDSATDLPTTPENLEDEDYYKQYQELLKQYKDDYNNGGVPGVAPDYPPESENLPVQ